MLWFTEFTFNLNEGLHILQMFVSQNCFFFLYAFKETINK